MNDNRKDGNNSGEDMSLADLLGGGEAESTTPTRVESRIDEPDSGMVNLAEMVASSNVEVAKTPSMAPSAMEQPVPEPSDSKKENAVAPAGMPVAAPQKKNSTPLVLGAIAILAVAVIVVVFATKGDDNDEATKALAAQQEAVALMAAQMEEMKKAQLDENSTTGDEMAKKMAALEAELEAAKAKESELSKATEVKEPAVVEEKKTAPKKVAAKPKTTTRKTSVNDLLKNAKKTIKTKVPKNSKNELDSLLGTSSTKKQTTKPKKAESSGLPKRLSKDDIKKAMKPVAARSQRMCAKYSTGAVQISVTVGGNGRVKKASPRGSFASSKAGQCVAMAARTAKFPKFKDSSQTFLYPIVLK